MVEMTSSLISVLLPVFNGGNYIKETINHILSLNDDNFELVICDDGSSDNSWEIICSFNDNKIRKYKNDKNIGMAKNYEKLVTLAQGRWVTIVGQDDFLLKNSISKLRTYIDKDSEASIFVTPRSYFYWSDVKSRRLKSLLNIGLPIMTKHRSRLRYRLTKCGITKYIYGPQFYTGTFLRKEIIENIKKKQQGIFFLGPIPDVSSAASILFFSDTYNRIWESLAIVGTSKSSVGLRIHNFLKNNEIGKNKDEISKIFLKNIEQKSYKPGLNGTLSSFIYYFYEQSENLEKFHRLEVRSKAKTRIDYTIILSNVFYEVLRANGFKTSVESKRVLHEVFEKQINRPLFFFLFIFFTATYIAYEILKYFYFGILFVFGRYKINRFKI